MDTRVPRLLKWLLGGGSRKRALAAAREAAAADTDFFSHAEARFALWEMLVREEKVDEATVVARDLARDFPDNAGIERFLTTARAGPQPPRSDRP